MPLTLRPLAASLVTLWLGVVPAAADEPALTEALRAANGGTGPALWFQSAPEVNTGTGPAQWVITPRGVLSARGDGPWGNPAGAFGPGEDGSGGAVSGSGASTLLAGDEGTLVTLLRTPEVKLAASLVTARGSWSDAQTFDLRITDSTKLSLWAMTGDATRSQFPLGDVVPGTWYLIALRWTRDGSGYVLRTACGALRPNEPLSHATVRLSAMGSPGRPILIGGRRLDDGFNPNMRLPLTTGRFCHYAVYSQALTDTALDRIHEAARLGAR